MEITKTYRLEPDRYIPVCAVANPATNDWYEGVNIRAIKWGTGGRSIYNGLFVSSRSGGTGRASGISFVDDSGIEFAFRLNENTITGLREFVIFVKGSGRAVITINATNGVVKQILDEQSSENVTKFMLDLQPEDE